MSLRKSSVGNRARNVRFAFKRSLCLSPESGLLGNLKTHAMKIDMKTTNTVATTATFAFKLTCVQLEVCAPVFALPLGPYGE
jgi:hypothetical protein